MGDDDNSNRRQWRSLGHVELEASGSWIRARSGERRKRQRPHRTPQAATSQLLLPPEVEVTWGQAGAQWNPGEGAREPVP